MSTFSQRIKEILFKEGLTIKAFCEKIGLKSPNTIQLIIRENRTPSPKTMKRILDGFPNMDADWFIYGESKKNQNNLPKSLSSNDDLTVTAKQIINQLDINSLHYTAMLEKKMTDDREHYNSVTEFNTNNQNKNIESLLEGYRSLENRLETKLQEVEAGVTKQILKKLAEDREYYNNASDTSQNIINILDGFKTLEHKVETHAVAASSKVVDTMAKAIAKQNDLLLKGFNKVTSLENELEDIKTYMAANFELDKMSKKKSKQIKKLNWKK